MSTHLAIHDELTAVVTRDVTTGAVAMELTFSPTVYGNSFVGSNSVTLFFRDTILAKRIGLDIAYRLKERADELAREPLAEAAE